MTLEDDSFDDCTCGKCFTNALRMLGPLDFGIAGSSDKRVVGMTCGCGFRASVAFRCGTPLTAQGAADLVRTMMIRGSPAHEARNCVRLGVKA